MVIEVMGIDDEHTSALEAAVCEALAALGCADEAEVRHVSDPTAIIARGARRWPALRVDGRVACSGRVPAVDEVCGYLRAAGA